MKSEEPSFSSASSLTSLDDSETLVNESIQFPPRTFKDNKVQRKSLRRSHHFPNYHTQPKELPLLKSEEATVSTQPDTDQKPLPQKPQKRRKISEKSITSLVPKGFMKPLESDFERVCNILALAHGGIPIRPTRLPGPAEESSSVGVNCGAVHEVLDGLIRTILSQNTSNLNSSRAKKALDDKFGRGNYQAIMKASVDELYHVIRSGGMASKKSKTIHQILTQISQQQNGNLSLEYLKELPDQDALEILVNFNGVGAKTASCVLMFCLGRDVFPVDTHVFRLSKALRWIPHSFTRESAFDYLNNLIPNQLKYPLHILLIKHGQRCKSCSGMASFKSKLIDKPKRTHNDCPLKDLIDLPQPSSKLE